MNRVRVLSIIGMLACHAAVGAGDEVIVIYNTRLPESRQVAEYYARRREVPTNQLFGFSLSTNDDMSRREFEDSLQKPLAKELEEKNLWHIRPQINPANVTNRNRVEWRVKDTKIRYAVLCYGVPFRIVNDPNLKEPAAETTRPELRRNSAAVDSELALLPCVEQHLPLTGPLNNPLFGATNAEAFSPTNGLLMVARLDGPSAAIARGLVDKAIEAETNGLWGRAYFDIRNVSDPDYKAGDEWINGAAEICRHLGFETVMETTPATFPPEFPMSQIALYFGWYDEHFSGPFTRPTVEFMPGAFAYHLHSTSASVLRNPARNWTGPLLAKGVTATMGCVDEPYLGGTPNVAVFAGRFLFFGFSFGEAAYASQTVLSWQTTVVGDPLYRPMGKLPFVQHVALTTRHSKLLEWSNLRIANVSLAKGAPPSEVVTLLEQTEGAKQSAVLTEKLAGLYAAQGKPTSAIDAYARALTLDPSPLQRVRLHLALAEKLAATGRDADAAEELAKLLQETPDYADRIGIYRRLLALAQKLGKTEAVANYEKRIKELSPPPKETH